LLFRTARRDGRPPANHQTRLTSPYPASRDAAAAAAAADSTPSIPITREISADPSRADRCRLRATPSSHVRARWASLYRHRKQPVNFVDVEKNKREKNSIASSDSVTLCVTETIPGLDINVTL